MHGCLMKAGQHMASVVPHSATFVHGCRADGMFLVPSNVQAWFTNCTAIRTCSMVCSGVSGNSSGPLHMHREGCPTAIPKTAAPLVASPSTYRCLYATSLHNDVHSQHYNSSSPGTSNIIKHPLCFNMLAYSASYQICHVVLTK